MDGSSGWHWASVKELFVGDKDGINDGTLEGNGVENADGKA